MNGLYEIVAGPEDGRFEVRLDPGHIVFRGHFPGKPVLPGVCSLMIVRECASRLAGRPLRYVSVREGKFLSVITPDARITVDVKLTGHNDGYPISATIRGHDTTMLKLKACLKPDEQLR